MSELCAFSFENTLLSSASDSDGLGPACVEAEQKLRLWGSQMELTEQFERGVDLSHDSAARKRELLGENVLSTATSGPAVSAFPAEVWLIPTRARRLVSPLVRSRTQRRQDSRK